MKSSSQKIWWVIALVNSLQRRNSSVTVERCKRKPRWLQKRRKLQRHKQQRRPRLQRRNKNLMTRSDHFTNKKRVRACHFCRVSQRDGARGSAATEVADSDGKDGILDE